ncbi:respirasome Complex Assembly Factor 1-like [Acropora millepora]|uniref:respirasome Complex Assembly Factor 1-like n=1 Tax=Acropora millepora TaxID=45264 RepID=UPI0010FCB4B5|nr:respirasome Complex Assembly Factor 1-like [Acropora millepora]
MSGQKVTKSSKAVTAANGSVSAIMRKAFKMDSTWEDKDEFLDVIYWFRQILAILLGIVWGILPLKGILAIGFFAAANAGVLYVYFTSYQKVDEEDYGGPWELTKEGFMTSFALFLVVWIVVYSAVHFP